MNLSYSAGELTQQQNGNGGNYIKAPFAGLVTLNTSVKKAQTGSFGVWVEFLTADEKKTAEGFWITEASFTIAKGKLESLVKSAGVGANVESRLINNNSEETFVTVFAEELNGKQVYAVFGGQEKISNEGKKFVNAVFNFAVNNDENGIAYATNYVKEKGDSLIRRIKEEPTAASFTPSPVVDPFAVPATTQVAAPVIDPFAVTSPVTQDENGVLLDANGKMLF